MRRLALLLPALALGAAALLPAPVRSQAGVSATPSGQDAASDSHGFVSATRFGQRDGRALYAAICAGCHMPDGRGAVGAGAYPALAGNAKLEFSGYPVSVVLNGLNGMPGFANQLDDAQVAAVVNWVRAELGNGYRADPATPGEVRAARQ